MACKVTHEYHTQACVRHASSDLLIYTCEPELMRVEHVNACVYSLSNSQVLAIKLGSTCNHLVGNSKLWWMCHVIETNFPGLWMDINILSTINSG